MTALMDAAGQLQPPLLAANYQTLIGLLSVTGLRLGEAIGLDRGDLDDGHQLLRILDSKFGKSREVVLHDSAMRALTDYGRLRDERFVQPRCEAFLVSTRGTRLRKNCIHHMFARLVWTTGLKPRSPGCRPRLHDLRHGLLSGRCWTGTATASMSKPGCRCFPHAAYLLRTPDGVTTAEPGFQRSLAPTGPLMVS